MNVTVFGSLIFIYIDFLRFYFSVFSLFFLAIEKIYQTRTSVFDYISTLLEVRQKYSTARCIFNSLLGVWKC